MHLAATGHNRGEGAHDWHESSQDDGDWAMLFKECFGTNEIFLFEEARVLALEQLAANTFTE